MKRIEDSTDRLQSINATYYIFTPYKAILSKAIKITLIVFLSYIFSANTLLLCILVPIYVLCLYMYYNLWLVCKRHRFKLLPYVICILVLNIPFLIISFVVRSLFMFLIENI